MINVSKPYSAAPAAFHSELQRAVYEALDRLHIPFLRVDTDEAITMEDCAAIDAALDMHTVKTLFLCNRKQTEFYLFVTPGDKPFRSKDFSAAMGIARVSFAPAETLLTMMGTKVGAATVFSALLPSARDVHFVFDRAVLADPDYGCSDGTTTGYMKVDTARITGDFLPSTGHSLTVIDV